MFRFPAPLPALCGFKSDPEALVGFAAVGPFTGVPVRLPVPTAEPCPAFVFVFVERAELPLIVIAPKTGPEFPSAPTC
jgi:hypothetical protein